MNRLLSPLFVTYQLPTKKVDLWRQGIDAVLKQESECSWSFPSLEILQAHRKLKSHQLNLRERQINGKKK